MWNYYLNAMIELNTDSTSHTSFKRFALKQAIEGAFQSNAMSENHYLQYIELLYANNPKDELIEQVFQKAIKAHQNSSNIWLQYTQYYIQENDPNKLNALRNVFEMAKKRLGPNSCDIWFLYLTYLKEYQSTETNAEFDRLISELACQPQSNFNVVKAQILEFLEKTTNMKRTRDTYNLFTKHFPGCYEAHATMSELEAKQVSKYKSIEKQLALQWKCSKSYLLPFFTFGFC